MSDLPILYSFRRCPYAMRARYVLITLNVPVALREVVLKNKPEALLSLGGRSTVPQLIDTDGTRYEESMDIIFWALTKSIESKSIEGKSINNDFFPKEKVDRIKAWAFQNDFRFKPWLDKYKYADRHPEHDSEYYRHQGERFLRRIEKALKASPYLLGHSISLADAVVFPFIRQFRGVDSFWFDQSQYQRTKQWLESLIESDTFQKVMIKHEAWQPEHKDVIVLK